MAAIMGSAERMRRAVRLAAMGLVLSAALVCSCDDFILYERLDGNGNGGPTGGELLIDPVSVTVHCGASVQFTASGGDPPYVFRITSGGGAIDPTEGRYTSPDAPGSSIVEVEDSAGATSSAQVLYVR